jgi:GT2 family glycosyltransferase
MITTDIVIVSYKDKEELERCVASIKEHCVDYNLIIEDNNVCNRGFTVATNDGLKKGSAPFRWILNSDAVVLKGTQQGLIDGFSFDKKVGIVGSMQLDFDDPDRIRAGGFLRMFPGGQHEPGLVSRGDCRFPKKQDIWTRRIFLFFQIVIIVLGPVKRASPVGIRRGVKSFINSKLLQLPPSGIKKT